jgi:hypothetical protein
VTSAENVLNVSTALNAPTAPTQLNLILLGKEVTSELRGRCAPVARQQTLDYVVIGNRRARRARRVRDFVAIGGRHSLKDAESAEGALARKVRDFVVIGRRHSLKGAEGALGAPGAISRDCVAIGGKEPGEGRSGRAGAEGARLRRDRGKKPREARCNCLYFSSIAPRFQMESLGGGPKGARPLLAQRSEAIAKATTRRGTRSVPRRSRSFSVLRDRTVGRSQDLRNQ